MIFQKSESYTLPNHLFHWHSTEPKPPKMPYNTSVVNQSTMYLSCPVTYDLQDAEWFENLDKAKDDAMDWSIHLYGEKVIVYEAVDGPYGYDYKPLSVISA